ncbi:hypothetical protein [Candidatus Villigracilis affinis]|uniref:hypothetical protein n=1 Tax=Candidatus Villigracilis affinis TaxID=3140682 RepID=UPI001D9CE449|nr:hypothetical protein [Anaerolineales bacterium]
MATIIFNGKSYNSLEEMPEKERKAYDQMMDIFADKNGNGIPDFMEGDMVQKVLAANSTSLNISGVTYHNLDELPPELRQSVDKAFQVITKLGIIPGVPAELQMQTPQASREPAVQSQPFVSREYAPAIQEESGRSIFPMVLGGIILFFCLAAGVISIFFFMTR